MTYVGDSLSTLDGIECTIWLQLCVNFMVSFHKSSLFEEFFMVCIRNYSAYFNFFCTFIGNQVTSCHKTSFLVAGNTIDFTVGSVFLHLRHSSLYVSYIIFVNRQLLGRCHLKSEGLFFENVL